MADEKPVERVERKARGPMGDGKPTNAKELAAVLERDRAAYVRRWRANPRVCADRPDSMSSEKWYGDGSAWTEERLRAAEDDSLFDPRVVRKVERPTLEVVVPPVAAGVSIPERKPWEALGISRRTWFRRKEGR